MDTGLAISLFSFLAAALGVLISYLAFAKKNKKEAEDKGENRGFIASEIGYIKAGVDDMKREIRETRKEIGDLSTRVTRVEESCKHAHERIDEHHNHK